MKTLYWLVYQHKDGYFDWVSRIDEADLLKCATLKDLITIKDIECSRPWEILRGTDEGRMEVKRFEKMSFIRLTFY